MALSVANLVPIKIAAVINKTIHTILIENIYAYIALCFAAGLAPALYNYIKSRKETHTLLSGYTNLRALYPD